MKYHRRSLRKSDSTSSTQTSVVRRAGKYGGVFLVVFHFFTAPALYAQLISPGALSRAHADLGGITNCTSCHALGQRSIDNARCLDCHTPLKTRIEANEGFHATVDDENCASCHKEHFGLEFDAIRLDTLDFDHDVTGFELAGSHADTGCRNCHRPEYILAEDVRSFKGEHGALAKTFLGIDATCIGCHRNESPHQNQFPNRECSNCHGAEIWEEAPIFDHDESRFKLVGRHIEVSCDGCHKSLRSPAGTDYVQYVDLSFSTCEACHEDAHDDKFGADCASCHSPNGWDRLKQSLSSTNFDHETTGFSLVGAHNHADCSSCHGKPARRDTDVQIAFVGSTDRNAFPKIRADNCLSCHVDYHDGEFVESPGGAVCENCHGQHEWFPTTYDIERHNRESAFELTGAHMATPCVGCHKDGGYTFSIENTLCEDCHQEENPHGTQFTDSAGKTECESCHSTEAWHWASTAFDHDQTDFPLTGRHSAVTCESCHPRETLASGQLAQRFNDLESACESCHLEEDPHQGQFIGTTCASCHTTASFTVAAFNHDNTRFPLTGAHLKTQCADCHKQETAPDQTLFTRFRPIGRECHDCHGEE